MKKIGFMTALLVVSAAPAFAQTCGGTTVYGPNLTFAATAPSGACRDSDPVQKVCASGVLYTCGSVTNHVGTWGAVGGGGGVTTFNTRTGAVTLNNADVAATGIMGVHLNSYVTTPSTEAGCASGSGYTDNTTQMQAAMNAAAALFTYLIVDNPGVGNIYCFSQLTVTNGMGMVGTGFYGPNGSVLMQIPGENEDALIVQGSGGITGYRHYMEMSGFALFGDETATSITGRGIVFPERNGELTRLHNLEVSNFPNDGIATEYGSDPLSWADIIASGNGYGSGGGCGINLTKTTGDPFSTVELGGVISGDADVGGTICISNAGADTTGDSIHIASVKGEKTYNNGKNTLPALVVMNNMNRTPVTIDSMSEPVISTSATVTNIVRSGCNGTTCTVVMTYVTGTVGPGQYNYPGPPVVGATFTVTGNSQSVLNASFVATANTATTVTATQTTAGSNLTGTGGTATWNNVIDPVNGDALIELTGNYEPNLWVGAAAWQGGTSSTNGVFGAANFIYDSNSTFFAHVKNSYIPNFNAAVGAQLSQGWVDWIGNTLHVFGSYTIPLNSAQIVAKTLGATSSYDFADTYGNSVGYGSGTSAPSAFVGIASSGPGFLYLASGCTYAINTFCPFSSSDLYTSPTNINLGTYEHKAAGACETTYGITTVNTGGVTTTTGQNCLPANAVIDAVLYRITTTITTATGFTVGQSGSLTQFCSTQSTLTAGTTGICVPSAYAPQTSAAPVVLTFVGTPGAGAIRVVTYYHTWTAPTS